MNVKDYFKLNLEKNLWVHICLYSAGEIELSPIDRSYFLVPIFLRKEGGYRPLIVSYDNKIYLKSSDNSDGMWSELTWFETTVLAKHFGNTFVYQITI